MANVILLIYGPLICIALLLGNTLVFANYYSQFWLLTAATLVHNLIELFFLYRSDRRLYFIQPVVLGVIVLFLLQFGGFTNYLMKRNDGEFAIIYNNILVNEPVWLARCMSLVLASSVIFWLGYKLSLGRHLYNFYSKYYDRFWNYTVSAPKIILGWFVGCVIKIIINQYGAIGHKYIILSLEGKYIPPFIMRLKVFENLSLLFLIMLLFIYYKNKSNRFILIILVIGFIFELIFAITSGSRFTIISLFLGLFFVDYFFSDKIKLSWVIVLGGLLYFSMTVIKGYKDYLFKNMGKNVELVNPLKSVEMAIQYNNIKHVDPRLRKDIEEAGRISVIGRFNYVNEMAQMIRYKSVKGLRNNDPDFLTPFFTFPIFALFPRYYLFGESEPRYGYWATKKLSGGKTTSTAISPIGFTYLAGGAGLVLLIFFILGVLMKYCGLLVKNLKGVAGFIIMIAMLNTLVLFDSVVTGSFINLIRFGLLMPPLMWLFLKK